MCCARAGRPGVSAPAGSDCRATDVSGVPGKTRQNGRPGKWQQKEKGERLSFTPKTAFMNGTDLAQPFGSFVPELSMFADREAAGSARGFRFVQVQLQQLRHDSAATRPGSSRHRHRRGKRHALQSASTFGARFTCFKPFMRSQCEELVPQNTCAFRYFRVP